MKQELEIIKQLFNSLSDTDKKTLIKSLKSGNKSKTAPKFSIIKEIKECPHCKSSKFVKNGTSRGTRRFLCRECGKSFTTTNNTIFANGKKDLSVWQKYIHCMIEKYPLRKTAEICGVSLPTAFAWRHKILDALQEMQEQVKLDGVVEADETFVPLSFKGHHKSFNLPRLAKHRGEPATRRGLSKEQVCVTCCVNLDGLSISKISNLGKPKLKDLEKVLSGKINQDSVFVTDSFRAYLKLSNDMELNHIRIPRNKYSNGAFNIQVINSYHSRLKAMLTYNFKGVSTKYLNNYLVYHNFVNFAKDSRSDKERILLNHIISTDCISKSIDIANRPAIPVAA
ncbi:IS1595-like element ISCco3 family transposase [Campylobacter jejuni]|uniref:IS1595-like element ISCco3 family transposase n=1 Tax=Campylobacter hyointestinalis TaxID=198 RepID=UPI0011ABC99A|nr:IS1595-like element ISCco3 family transposase [Campylobacter hyointestinalis]MBX1003590.1 IS1595-like element ISCco3 family transposase [Campylobacter jejuni]MCE7128287.1 IS1595-like element ISCco3 family transposase [Campylobacter coli]MBX1022413.1 IS1595-like element ISCco3 family transposase [Campylobacter jejuni]MBX1231804.1 IS1595-like element ISCco3 family transposase [Campylobacter jejuni]MBX1337586.1 IS1595-like element ISCco3 family transposase [Campylobacter jejuni]